MQIKFSERLLERLFIMFVKALQKSNLKNMSGEKNPGALSMLANILVPLKSCLSTLVEIKSMYLFVYTELCCIHRDNIVYVTRNMVGS